MTSTVATELHEQIRRVLAEADHFNFESLEPWDYQQQTAAVLRAVADHCDEAGAEYGRRAVFDQATAAFALMETFRRAADKAEYAAARCDFVACEPGGEPCDTHERLMAHAEGDHELCDHQAAGTDGDGSAWRVIRHADGMYGITDGAGDYGKWAAEGAAQTEADSRNRTDGSAA